MTPSNALDVLQRAAHQRGVGHAVPVVAEDPHRGPANRPWRRSRPAASRPDPPSPRRSAARRPGRSARPSRHTCSTTPAVSAHRVGVRHREHRGEAAERGRRRTGLRRSRRPRGRARAGGCAGRPDRAAAPAPWPSINVVRRGRRRRSELGDHAVLDQHVELRFAVRPHVAEYEPGHGRTPIARTQQDRSGRCSRASTVRPVRSSGSR